MSSSRPCPPDPSTLPAPTAFGTCVDNLDIDFGVSDRTQTAVSVVAGLSAPLPNQSDPTDWAWKLPVSSRTLQLLRILQATPGNRELTLRLPCPDADCGEALEVAMPVSDLIAHGEEALDSGSELTWELAPSRTITVRRATGLDQKAWRRQQFARQHEANRALLSSLVVRGKQHLDNLDESDAAKKEELSEALLEFDPLAAFRVATRCPACGQQATNPVDLEQACLDRLRTIQRELFESIHRLAKTHGWSEFDIIRLSPRRRAAYLALIEREEATS